MPEAFLGAFLFILGSIIGSFLNVCIYRMPKEESVVRPRSHCRYCRKIIAWYDNIPLLSFFLLKGRCRHCKKKISWRYFWVELITAFTLVFLWKKFGLSWQLPAYFAFASSLIVITFIDLDYMLIPDLITLPGVGLGLLVGSLNTSFLESFGGIAVGGGLFLAIAYIGQIIIKREVLGLGDVKMMAMVGAFLGIINTFITIFLASMIGSLIGIMLIVLKKKSRRDEIPFGPFLSLGALLTLIWGEHILYFWERLSVIAFHRFFL